ncbi:hypothetical protein FRC08_011175 [Ceratobasidium sp. 394]|nr:hypothetical protein FRC08_011175 [Ceratobasidium sp. 394]
MTTRANVHSDGSIEYLPDSLLSSIFLLLYRGWDKSDAKWCGTRHPHIPYALASVSRRWRAVALSTSRLWDLVDLSLPSEILATHLARSKSVPIDVDLVWGKNVHANLQKSLGILEERRNWTRVRYLDATLGFELPSATGLIMDALNSAIDANPTDVLEGIRVTILDRPDAADLGRDKLHLHIPQSQALKTIDVHSISLSHVPSSPLLRLEQLRLVGVNVDLSDLLLPLLELAPNLKTLSLNGCRFWFKLDTESGTWGPTHSISLPRLGALLLDAAGGVNIIFQKLNMPNLRILNFSTHSNYPSWQASIDWNAICRCSALRSLTLTGFSSELLLELLSHIGGLAQLESIALHPSLYSAPDDFAEQLARRLLDTSQCPMLVDLSLFFSLHRDSLVIIGELRRTRPLLRVYVEPNESEYEDGDAGSEGGLSEAENRG